MGCVDVYLSIFATIGRICCIYVMILYVIKVGICFTQFNSCFNEIETICKPYNVFNISIETKMLSLLDAPPFYIDVLFTMNIFYIDRVDIFLEKQVRKWIVFASGCLSHYI
jgi:hypothetical protein